MPSTADHRTNRRRRRAAIVATASLALTIALGVTAISPSHAQTPAPISVEVLTGRAQFTDDLSVKFRVKLDGMGTSVLNIDDPSRTVVARITVPPGAQFPWHMHPGPVIVNVAAGELVYVMAHDCTERTYPSGTAFVDPGNMVHTAFNSTGVDTVLVATFFDVPAEGPLTITAGVTPGNC